MVERVQYQQRFEPLFWETASGEGPNDVLLSQYWMPASEPQRRRAPYRQHEFFAPPLDGTIVIPTVETIDMWAQPTSQPYLRVIRHPELLPPYTHVLTPEDFTEYVEQPQGFTLIEVRKPDGTFPAGLTGPIEAVVSWETQRKLNEVGSWTAQIPLGEPLVSGTPLSELITRGWKVSILQENNHPLHRVDLEYLMYRGVVEQKSYEVDGTGKTVVTLKGSLRGIELSNRATPTVASYADQAASTIASDIEGGLAGGITCPSSSPLTIAFGGDDSNGIISRYARLLALGEYTHWALRESWVEDRLEFLSVYAPPDSGYRLVNQEAAGPEQALAGKHGFALIGASPKLQYDGTGIVNVVIPFGSDFDGSPLTVQDSTKTAPYTVLPGLNPDGTYYWYLEDTPSVARYGRMEMPIHNTAIKNPSDDVGTRAATADVLYAWATGELLKNRSAKLFVEVPVANGAQVWALPGDKIKMQYTGLVIIDGVEVQWKDIDQWFLVTSRTDTSDTSGVRQVSFTLAAPEIEIHLPDLPDAVLLPITEDVPGSGDVPGGGSFPGPGGMPPGGPSPYPDCCDDPTVDVPDVDPDYDPPGDIQESDGDGGDAVATEAPTVDGWYIGVPAADGSGPSDPPSWGFNLRLSWSAEPVHGTKPTGTISGTFYWGDGQSTAITVNEFGEPIEDGDLIFLPGPDNADRHSYSAYTRTVCYAVVSAGGGVFDTRTRDPNTIIAFPLA